LPQTGTFTEAVAWEGERLASRSKAYRSFRVPLACIPQRKRRNGASGQKACLEIQAKRNPSRFRDASGPVLRLFVVTIRFVSVIPEFMQLNGMFASARLLRSLALGQKRQNDPDAPANRLGFNELYDV
jgi:hypothetical protein